MAMRAQLACNFRWTNFCNLRFGKLMRNSRWKMLRCCGAWMSMEKKMKIFKDASIVLSKRNLQT